MKHITTKLTLLALLCAPLVSFAQGQGGVTKEGSPGLLITKTRIILEGRDRSDMLSLSNNGSVPGVYKVELLNKRMEEDGSIVDAPETLEGELFAKDILRISPRRITLGAGESQNIRILARKPKGLADGEYRSHLNITADQVEEAASPLDENALKEDELSVSVRASFGITIPVIVRHGELQGGANISNIALGSNEKGIKTISFAINREGQKSTYGDILITYTDKKGKESVVKSIGGLAVYAPTPVRKVSFPLDVPDGITLDKGTIEVSYSEKEDAGGQVIAEAKLVL